MASSEARRRAIVELVRRQGFAPIDALAEQFAVTPQTIRRDINELSAAGTLQRFHGGAGLPSSVENLAYPARQVLCLEEKRRIARLAARHVPDHASLFINIGTTTEEVAKALLQHHGLSVITNNLNVASILAGKPDFRVIVAGGLVRSRDRGLVGERLLVTLRAAQRRHAAAWGAIRKAGWTPAQGAITEAQRRELADIEREWQRAREQANAEFRLYLHYRDSAKRMVAAGVKSPVDANPLRSSTLRKLILMPSLSGGVAE